MSVSFNPRHIQPHSVFDPDWKVDEEQREIDDWESMTADEYREEFHLKALTWVRELWGEKTSALRLRLRSRLA